MDMLDRSKAACFGGKWQRSIASLLEMRAKARVSGGNCWVVRSIDQPSHKEVLTSLFNK